MQPGRYWQGGGVPSEQTTRDPGGRTTVVLSDGDEPPPELELHAARQSRLRHDTARIR